MTGTNSTNTRFNERAAQGRIFANVRAAVLIGGSFAFALWVMLTVGAR